MEGNKKFKFPSSIIILSILILFVTVLTYVVPAGQFEMVENAESGKMMVDATTYHHVDNTPVTPFRMFVAIPEGFINGASIIFLIMFGYFWVYSVLQTGAFGALIHKMLSGNKKDSKLFIPMFMFIFALAGSTYGEFETVYGLIPIFVALAIALGYDAIVGICMSGMAVAVGFACATTNPFTIGIAQSFGELPLFSGLLYRWIIFVVMVPIAIFFTMRYANKIKKNPESSLVYGLDFSSFSLQADGEEVQEFTTRHKLLLLSMLVTVVTIVAGSLKLGWYLNEMSGIFLISGIVASLIAGIGPEKIGNNLVKSCSEMVFAAIVVGFSRTILVIMQNGVIIDTVINGMYLSMKSLSTWATAEVMLIAQTFLNFFIPSGSGQANAIMPIMIPLSDLSGLNRQIAVLAYQFGDGFSNLLWPTGAIAIMTGIAKVPLGKWYRFFLPIFGVFFIIQSAFIIISVMINYGPF